MKVICAGLSKTGTKSLAKALRILGLTVYDHLEHTKFHHKQWVDLYGEGKLPDFGHMYEGVDAVIGLPVPFWYEEIYAAFPNAKVILSIRDNEDMWVQSWAKHVGYGTTYGGYGAVGRVFLDWLVRVFVHKVHILKESFILPASVAAFGSMNPKSTVIAKKLYRGHNERVQAVIPKEKLLIYNVKKGWKPLWRFLGCNVPDQEFPSVNVGLSFAKGQVSTRLQLLKRNTLIFLGASVLIVLILSFPFLSSIKN